MKNNIKKAIPYITFNAIIFTIIGAIIGKNLAEIHNTKKMIAKDSKALKEFLKDISDSATHIKIEDIDEEDVPEDIRKKAEDPRDPMDPTVIYVYN